MRSDCGLSAFGTKFRRLTGEPDPERERSVVLLLVVELQMERLLKVSSKMAKAGSGTLAKSSSSYSDLSFPAERQPGDVQ